MKTRIYAAPADKGSNDNNVDIPRDQNTSSASAITLKKEAYNVYIARNIYNDTPSSTIIFRQYNVDISRDLIKYHSNFN